MRKTKAGIWVLALLVAFAAASACHQDPVALTRSANAATVGQGKGATSGQTEVDSWNATEARIATELLLRNISPEGAAKGVVLASPSRSEPDYYYNWTRDSALSMRAVVGLYERATNPADKSRYLGMLQDYLGLARHFQLSDNPTGGQADFFKGYGEPKFNVDGTVFTGPWGRPQNDGPALRALTVIRLARAVAKQGDSSFLASVYDADASKSLLKSDLEFVAHHWDETSFDLWEETEGHNFYTEMVQRRALVEGARVADQLGDGAAAAFYRAQASRLETEIGLHWDAGRGYLVTTLDRVAGNSSKVSNLDASVVLAALHAAGSDGFIGPTDERVLATAVQLEKVFTSMYGVNGVSQDAQGLPLAPGIGRYPEDVYDGAGTSRGNPWVLLTAGFAELNFRVANRFQKSQRIPVTALSVDFLTEAAPPKTAIRVGETISARDPRFAILLQGLRARGDAYLRRVKYHENGDGSLSEEIDRQTGYMRGARDLSWSYASVLTAIWSRAASP